MFLVLASQGLGEGGRPGEVEDSARPRLGVEPIGEVRLGATRLEDEREPAVLGLGRQPDIRRQSFGIHRRLPLDTRQRSAFRLGLDHPDDTLVHVEQVVGSTVCGRHCRLAARNALRGEQVERPAVLHRPTRVGELSVDEHAGARLRSKAVGVVPEVHGDS